MVYAQHLVNLIEHALRKGERLTSSLIVAARCEGVDVDAVERNFRSAQRSEQSETTNG